MDVTLINLKNILKFCGFDSLNLGDEKKLFFIKHKKHIHPKKRIIKNKKKIITKRNEKKSIIIKNEDKKNNKKKEIKADP